jgi:hypothetical protein
VLAEDLPVGHRLEESAERITEVEVATSCNSKAAPSRSRQEDGRCTGGIECSPVSHGTVDFMVPEASLMVR